MTLTRTLRFSSLALFSFAAPACDNVAGIAPDYVCTSTASVVCAPGSTGYQCADEVTVPSQEYSTVGECSPGANFGGADTYYCCASPTGATSTCAPNSAVPCTNGTGYACTGPDSPSWSNSSLLCNTGTPAGSSTYFCCQPIGTVTSTCVADSTNVSCDTGTGYSCAGADTPAWTNFSLVCGPGVATGVSTSYCCASAAGAAPDAATADSETDASTGTTEPDASTTDTDSSATNTDSATTDEAEDAGSCPLGVDTGAPTCDSCLEGSCCYELVACDTPDDAGVNDAGMTACESLVTCIDQCMVGNPAAGVPGDTLASCQVSCQIDYSDTETANAMAFVTCQTTTCAASCQ